MKHLTRLFPKQEKQDYNEKVTNVLWNYLQVTDFEIPFITFTAI